MNKRNKNKVEVSKVSEVAEVVIPEVLPKVIPEVLPEVVDEMKPKFLSRRRVEYLFARFEDSDIVAWRKDIRNGDNHECIGILKTDMIDSDNLKFIGVWDKLGKEVQDRSLKLDEGGVTDKLEMARSCRRRKYENVPTEVKCSNCGVLQKMPPGQIVKRVEKIAAEKSPVLYLLEDFLKGFVCQKCCPTKGRKKNHNLPAKIELVCKCGKKILYPASVAIKFAEKKGLTVEKYVKNYKCQVCNPTKGRHKKGKK